MINYVLGLCTPDEEKEIEHWLDREPGNVALLREVAREIGHEGSLSFSEKREIKSQIFKDIKDINKAEPAASSRVKGPKTETPGRSSGFLQSGRWLKAAAAVLIIATAGLIGLYYNHTASLVATDMIEWQRRTLSNGQTATLRFGDGSVINLNAGSTLRYPEKFSEDKREVYLQGEAFFSIIPDTSRPFIVHAGNIKTYVLGTSFNIRAYENEDDLQVTVADGRVAVSQSVEERDADRPETVLLNENQWITYRSSGGLVEKGEGGIEDLIAWKNRKLVFNDQPLEQIAKRLERWYNLRITVADSALNNRRLSAAFDKETMREVLAVITLSLDISYQKKGQKVIFYENE